MHCDLVWFFNNFCFGYLDRKEVSDYVTNLDGNYELVNAPIIHKVLDFYLGE
jgi:hypothetical protein